MTSVERKPAVLVIAEDIEMELFTSEESCTVMPGQDVEEEYKIPKRQLEHPLVSQSDEEPEAPVHQCSEASEQQAHLKKVPSLAIESKEDYPSVPDLMEEIEIEMEVFPPIRVSESELVEIKSDHSSIMTLLSPEASPNKVSRMKWKRLDPQRKGLVVKDIVCLPKGYYLTQQDRHGVPQSKERAALAAMGLSTRVTIDCNWSANQMASRLATHFKGRFTTQPGQRFSFTYLQCMQGPGVLIVPDPPPEGWTGEQVLKLCGHGSLYIVSHHDYTQAESDELVSETPGVDRQEFCHEASTESCQEEKEEMKHPLERHQPLTPRTVKEVSVL